MRECETIKRNRRGYCFGQPFVSGGEIGHPTRPPRSHLAFLRQTMPRKGKRPAVAAKPANAIPAMQGERDEIKMRAVRFLIVTCVVRLAIHIAQQEPIPAHQRPVQRIQNGPGSEYSAISFHEIAQKEQPVILEGAAVVTCSEMVNPSLKFPRNNYKARTPTAGQQCTNGAMRSIFLDLCRMSMV